MFGLFAFVSPFWTDLSYQQYMRGNKDRIVRF
jgi:hypothetical protein